MADRVAVVRGADRAKRKIANERSGIEARSAGLPNKVLAAEYRTVLPKEPPESEHRTKRRERWINRKAWRASVKGNATIRIEGYRVTVFRRGSQWAWWIAIGDKPEFSTTNYDTPEAAALGAFDRFEEATGKWHKPRS